MAVFLSSQQFEWYKVIIPALNTVNKTREYVFFLTRQTWKKKVVLLLIHVILRW